MKKLLTLMLSLLMCLCLININNNKTKADDVKDFTLYVTMGTDGFNLYTTIDDIGHGTTLYTEQTDKWEVVDQRTIKLKDGFSFVTSAKYAMQFVMGNEPFGIESEGDILIKTVSNEDGAAALYNKESQITICHSTYGDDEFKAVAEPTNPQPGYNYYGLYASAGISTILFGYNMHFIGETRGAYVRDLSFKSTLEGTYIFEAKNGIGLEIDNEYVQDARLEMNSFPEATIIGNDSTYGAFKADNYTCKQVIMHGFNDNMSVHYNEVVKNQNGKFVVNDGNDTLATTIYIKGVFDKELTQIIHDGKAYGQIGGISPQGEREASELFRILNNKIHMDDDGAFVYEPEIKSWFGTGTSALIFEGDGTLRLKDDFAFEAVPDLSTTNAISLDATGNLIIEGNGENTLRIYAPNSSMNSSSCIRVARNLILKDINVEIIGDLDTDGDNAPAIQIGGNLILNNSTIKATSRGITLTNKNYSYVICDEDSKIMLEGEIPYLSLNPIESCVTTSALIKGSDNYPVAYGPYEKGYTYYAHIFNSNGIEIPHRLIMSYKKYEPLPEDPKDESCEAKIGPTWHWNNTKKVCEEVALVATSTH